MELYPNQSWIFPCISCSWSRISFRVMSDKGLVFSKSVFLGGAKMFFITPSPPRCTAAFIVADLNIPQIIALMLICSIPSFSGRLSFRRTFECTFSKYSTLFGDIFRMSGNSLVRIEFFVDLAISIPVLELEFTSG